MTTERLPNGVIVCLAPGAELTDDERNTLVEYFDFLRDRKAIEAQCQGAESEADARSTAGPNPEGWTIERRLVGPWRPVPATTEESGR